MKYVRVILAVEEHPSRDGSLNFDERLEVFIEEDVAVQGAYVSGDYDTREQAIHGLWKEQ
jgi:hypothetical protein